KFNDFTKIGFRIGKILSATLLTKARKPAYKLQVDFGEIGKKVSSAQLPANYEVDQVVGKTVVGVVNLPPRRIAGVKSEALIVGFPDSQGNVFLLNTRSQETANGSQLAECGQHVDEINYDDFQKADIRSATVLSVEPLEENEGAFHVKLDAGKYGEKLGFLNDIDQETVNTLIDIPDQRCNTLLLTFHAVQSDNTKKAIRLPLGVDGNGQVVNGEKLF
ncbi:nucleic acid-binding protein, partial [Rhizophagus irregularis]